MQKTTLVAIAALLTLQGCSSDQGIILEEDQLKRMITREKSFEWVAHGFTGSLTLTKTGKSELTVAALGADKGTWKQQGDTICLQFKRAIQGTERCAKVARFQDGTYEARDSKSNTKLAVFYPEKSQN